MCKKSNNKKKSSGGWDNLIQYNHLYTWQVERRVGNYLYQRFGDFLMNNFCFSNKIMMFSSGSTFFLGTIRKMKHKYFHILAGISQVFCFTIHQIWSCFMNFQIQKKKSFWHGITFKFLIFFSVYKNFNIYTHTNIFYFGNYWIEKKKYKSG